MNRWTVLLVTGIVLLAVTMGCSSGDAGPVAPATTPGISTQSGNTGQQSQTHLWDFCDILIDIENETVEVVSNRSAMFSANVVQFLNSNPAGVGVSNLTVDVQTDYIDCTLDIILTHPLTIAEYNGYDVRGIFIGDGSVSMAYNSDLEYADEGSEQTLMNADGFSRWWNPDEFGNPGVLGYTPGAIASPGYEGSATLNPYKYFADGLGATGDLWTFLTTTSDDGVFTAGSANSRHYEIRFPNPPTGPGVVFNYAVVANWESMDPADHPSNAPEAVALNATVTDGVFYVDGDINGGLLMLDLDVFNWGAEPVGGVMEDYLILIESDVLSSVYTFSTSEMTPIGGGANYSTYHVDISADNVTHNSNTEDGWYWVIVEDADDDYTNNHGVPNNAGSDSLAAFFYGEFFIADYPINQAPTINSGVTGEDMPIEWTVETYNVDATDPDGDPLTYTWTLTDGNGDPVEGYDGVEGDGAGNLDIDWGEVAGWTQGVTPFDLDCIVDDGEEFVPAATLECEVWVEGDWWVSNHDDFSGEPDNGTQEEPFSTINQAFMYYSSGDTIVVDYGTGTYDEQIYRYYNNGCTLRAWSWHTTPAARPKLTYSGNGYVIYSYYTNDLTIQGFEVEIYPGTGSGGYMPLYAYYSHNITIIDCHFTGTVSYYYMYAMYLYYCNDITVKNNKWSDLNTSYSSTYAYLYFYFYRGTGTHNVVQNEFTEFQESVETNGYMYIYMYAYYWPNGSNWTNNLFHHISPDVGTYFTLYLNRIYYPYNTVTVANNTIDSIDADSGTNSYSSNIYGMYAYNGGSSTYGYDAHSNIVSNLTGSYYSPNYYGMYCYNISPDYNDVWNIQDYPYPSAGGGPNSISSDPLFVNNTEAPYDYHLDDDSPCIGTGKNGEDMGCYGNLPTGETIVGLLTPE